MEEPSPVQSPNQMEEFIRLLSEHDQPLTAYVLSMIPSESDAKDILQETKVALWQSFHTFTSGTNFGSWARKAAYHRILNFKRQKGIENKRIWFSDKCYELLTDDFETAVERREEQTKKLSDCIAQLQKPHREILTLRYFNEASIEEVATQVNRSVEATYRVLSRIRLALRNCLNRNTTTAL